MSKIVILNSSRFGQGNPRLGESLMNDFFEALAMQETAPDAILFYNSAVNLACQEPGILNPLHSLEKRGTRLMVSASSLNFYNLSQELKAGTIASMEEMTEVMMNADTVIKP